MRICDLHRQLTRLRNKRQRLGKRIAQLEAKILRQWKAKLSRRKVRCYP